MKHFAIVGRICGDEEDTCLVVDADSQEEAQASFETQLYEMAEREKPVDCHDDSDDCCFINAILESDSPIEIRCLNY